MSGHVRLVHFSSFLHFYLFLVMSIVYKHSVAHELSSISHFVDILKHTFTVTIYIFHYASLSFVTIVIIVCNVRVYKYDRNKCVYYFIILLLLFYGISNLWREAPDRKLSFIEWIIIKCYIHNNIT